MNNYSEKEYEIFSRLFILDEFSEKNLNILSKIKIGIIGIGGIGCPLSQYLVNSGIKELVLVDGDTVEKSNLNRQILFNLNDIGKKKVDVAKNKLQLINNECKIESIDKNIDSSNINSLVKCSIVVDATDNWLTSKLLNQYCLENSIDFLYSSVLKHDLQIILFNNSDKSNHLCLNCIFPNKDEIDLPRCSTVGISGISAGLAGLVAAQKIINFSLNLKDETNIMTISDGKKLNIDNIIIKSKHDCYLKSV
ncbi:ThiF family adenylyltransferase [Pelagibacteraceae bacterium]|nr:ThiF family adenylyltransferase [Pelagibacteraceae bacterium]